MTNRERLLNILDYKTADRMPAVHFGYWRELLDEWAEQGHISKVLAATVGDGNLADLELDKKLGWDFCYTALGYAHNGLYPGFPHKVLKKDAEGTLYQSHTGVINLIKDGAEGIPQDVDYLLKDRESYEKEYKHRIQFYRKRVSKFASFAHCVCRKKFLPIRPIGLFAGSAFGSLRDILTVVGMSYMICDDYGLLKEIVETWGDMQYKCIEAQLKKGLKADFLHMWEDICFRNGPLISPKMFDELCAPVYNRIHNLAKEYGIKYISIDCDGDILSLCKTWINNGINVMFPIEYGSWSGGFEKIRALCGKEMRGIGNFDKTVLREDKSAVDRELDRLKPLVGMGGFIPCPDHRLMPGSKWELVQYYTDKIKTIL